MEYGTKAWMGAHVDHHPDKAVIVVKIPTNHPSARYGVEVYGGTIEELLALANAPHDKIAGRESQDEIKEDSSDLEEKMWELDLLREEIDLEFDRDWDTFVKDIYHGDLAKAVEICQQRKNPEAGRGWINIRVYVMKQAEAYRIKNGLKV